MSPQPAMIKTQASTLSASCGSINTPSEGPACSASTCSDVSAVSATPPADGVTTEQVKFVRSHIEPRAQTDDATIKRFIRATGGNLSLSVKRLNATLAWRAKAKPEQVVCRACVKDPRSHYMHLVGYCKQGRPIIYSCLEAAANRVFEDNRDHMIQTFEMAVKCMPPGVEQWIWVCDFKGFGMADVNPKLAKLFLDISGEHYPERLALFLVVDAPSLFGLLWRAISPFVDPKTYKKIRFLPWDASPSSSPDLSKSRLAAELSLHFDDVTVQWFVREMDENRNKATVRKKVYNMYSMYEQALSGELCDGHQHAHAHCHHGHLAATVAGACTEVGKAGTAPAAHAVKAAAGPAAAATAEEAAAATGVKDAAGVKVVVGTAAAAAALAHPAVHNYLGTPALLHTLNLNPDLMLPQATATATGPSVPHV